MDVSLPSVSRRRFLQLCGAGAAVTLGARYIDFLVESGKQPPLQIPLTQYPAQDIKKLRFSIHPRMDLKHQVEPMMAMMDGLMKHGLSTELAGWDEPSDADISVIFTWKQKRVIAHAEKNKRNILVLDWGYFKPRKPWTSVGINGLNGYSTFAQAPHEPNADRFHRLFGNQLKPWRHPQSGPVLLIGQLPWDAALHGLNMNQWLDETASKLKALGHEVVYRPHPVYAGYMKEKGQPIHVPSSVAFSQLEALDEDMARASFLVTYTSTTAVDAILAGISAVTLSPGSIAWPITSHDIAAPIIHAKREPWCNQLAWQQWSLEELRSGDAWEHTKHALIAR